MQCPYDRTSAHIAEIEGSCVALGFDRCIEPDGIEMQLYQLTQIRERLPNYLFDD